MVELTQEDLLSYYHLPKEALPEAFPEVNTAPSLPMLPKSGCKGLQARAPAVLRLHSVEGSMCMRLPQGFWGMKGAQGIVPLCKDHRP